MDHVTDEEIGWFLSGRLEPARFRQVLRHLLHRCPACERRLGPLTEAVFRDAPLPAAVDDPDYDGAIDRAFEKVAEEVSRFEKEKRQLERLLASARGNPQGIGGVLEPDSGPPSWSVVEALLELSYEARCRDPREMLRLAFIARYASRNLDPRRYNPALIADLQARAWAELGNAYRVNDEFEAAEDAFAHAIGLLEEGTGDALLLARLLDVEASLRRSQRRLPEAIELLGDLSNLYEQIGEIHLAGRALISRGINTYYDGKAGEAVTLLRRGLAMLDPLRDPQLIQRSQQNLLLALVDSGELQEARKLLLESDLRRKLAPEPLNLLKLRWIEGKIHAGQNKLWRAEALFREVREGFLQRGMGYDAALVGLELVEVWLRQDKSAEARGLTLEIVETFEDLGVQREALRAMRFLETACRTEAATPSMAARVILFLRRLEWEPRLQFAL